MSKPTLGYPSRTAACLALRAQGLSWSQIAARCGISVECATNLAYVGARSRAGLGAGAKVPIRRALLNRLAGPAARRGTTTTLLAQRVIETAIEEGLVEAILDDGVLEDGP